MNKNIWLLLGGAALLVLLIWGFKGGNQPTGERNKTVVTSFYPLYFFTSAIGKEKIQVTNITPAGAEPHDYEPTADDLVKMEDSKLVVLNGAGLEAWGNNILQNLDPTRTLVIKAGEDLATAHVVEEEKEIIDPHVWLSPPLAKKMVEKIEAALEKVDEANATTYKSNALALNSKLDALNQEYTAGLNDCKSKNIITSHAAFGYLAKEYKLNQVTVTGISPDSEPSAQELAKVAKFAKENKVKYIFVESLLSPKLSDTIATEVGAKTLVLNPLEGLTPEEERAGKDYFSEMRNNLANLKIALECK